VVLQIYDAMLAIGTLRHLDTGTSWAPFYYIVDPVNTMPIMCACTRYQSMFLCFKSTVSPLIESDIIVTSTLTN